MKIPAALALVGMVVGACSAMPSATAWMIVTAPALAMRWSLAAPAFRSNGATTAVTITSPRAATRAAVAAPPP